MRMSRLLVRTLREAPADAEVVSHQLLVRGGFIRRLASGVYSFLPLGLRVLHNIEAIIREELDAADCQEVLLPALHPLELWEQSGRAAMFGIGRAARHAGRGPGWILRARSDPRGGGHRHRRCRGRLVPAAAPHRVPGPGQVPRRGPTPVRAPTDPRADHVRRLLLRCRCRGHAGLLPHRLRRLPADLRPAGPRRVAGRGRVRRHRRRGQPRVHGALGGGGGPLRPVRGLRLRGQRGGRHPGRLRRRGDPRPGRPRRRRAPHARPARHRRGGGVLR